MLSSTGSDRIRAEKAFKQQQKIQEASQAWRDLEAERAATAAKTARLKALRLARDAQAHEQSSRNIIVNKGKRDAS
jgi:hypothetical protein